MLAGVPVISSDNAGAKCLFKNQSASFTFLNKNVEDLMDLLAYIFNNKQIITIMKEGALSIADNITPYKCAKYLVNIFSYYFFGEVDSPSPPWVKC